MTVMGEEPKFKLDVKLPTSDALDLSLNPMLGFASQKLLCLMSKLLEVIY